MKDILVEDIDEISSKLNSKSRTYLALNIFKEAINDWPNYISTLKTYDKEVAIYLNETLTNKYNIEKALQTVNFTKDSWKAESLSIIVSVFDYFEKNQTLEQIIKTIILEYTAICKVPNR